MPLEIVQLNQMLKLLKFVSDWWKAGNNDEDPPAIDRKYALVGNVWVELKDEVKKWVLAFNIDRTGTDLTGTGSIGAGEELDLVDIV